MERNLENLVKIPKKTMTLASTPLQEKRLVVTYLALSTLGYFLGTALSCT